LIWDALAAFAARDCGELPVLRKAAFRPWDALAAFAAGFRGQATVLRETALLIRNRFAAHACYLALPLCVHRGESPIRGAPVLSWCLSHYESPPSSFMQAREQLQGQQ